MLHRLGLWAMSAQLRMVNSYGVSALKNNVVLKLTWLTVHKLTSLARSK